MQANFQGLKTYLSVNHVPLDDSGEGKHKYVSMPEQAAAPTTAANELALYSKEKDGESQLFYRKESDGVEVQITGDSSSSTNGSLTVAGITIQWGTTVSTNPANPAQAFIPFNTPYTTTYNVSMTKASGGNNALKITALSTNGFNLNEKGETVFWQAIGVL